MELAIPRPAFVAGFSGQVHAWMETLRARRKAHRVYVATRNELLALSERDLQDIGIARSDIHRIAREAAQFSLRA